MITVIPKQEWATPEQVEAFIEKLRGDVVEHKLISLIVIGECFDGNMYSGSTRIEDVFKVGAKMMGVAMEFLGFARK